MRDAAKRSGKLLMIGFVRRFGNDCAVVQDFINEGYFGDLYYAKATYLRRNGCRAAGLGINPVPAAALLLTWGCMSLTWCGI